MSLQLYKNIYLIFCQEFGDSTVAHPNATKLSEEILSQKGQSGIISHSPRLLPKVTFETFLH